MGGGGQMRTYKLGRPVHIGRRRISKLKFRRINDKLLNLAEQLRAGLAERNCDSIQCAVATVAFAADLPLNVVSVLSADDLVGALEEWTDAIATYSVEGARG